MTRFGRAIAGLLITLSVMAAASPAAAASCSVASSGVAFGPYDSLNSMPLDGVGSVSVTCDTSVAFTVSLGGGGGSGGTRQLAGGAASLAYELYTDASRTIIWGDGTTGSTVSGSGTNVDLPVYGRIPERQTVPAGTYSDSITMTVSY